MLLFLMALDTKRPVDTSTIAKDTKEHVLVSWSAQGALAPLVITGAKGSWLHAGERRILDFSSGLVNVNLSHGHPKVVRAIQEQAERLCYVTPSFGEESRAELARLVAEVTPGDLTKTLFTTGGSEANEHALRIARMHTKRHKVLTQWRSFHGQTQGAATLGGDNRRWANEPGITGVVRGRARRRGAGHADLRQGRELGLRPARWRHRRRADREALRRERALGRTDLRGPSASVRGRRRDDRGLPRGAAHRTRRAERRAADAPAARRRGATPVGR